MAKTVGVEYVSVPRSILQKLVSMMNDEGDETDAESVEESFKILETLEELLAASPPASIIVGKERSK